MMMRESDEEILIKWNKENEYDINLIIKLS